MQTNLAPQYRDTLEGQTAEAVLRKCVHCGFCTATCPTYQLLGDELDGPRGRIYLIKQVLEGAEPTRATQQHLDRCLTCRNCESTCPSGVQYGQLIDVGRKLVEDRVERPKSEQVVRWLLKEGLTSPFFSPAMKLGQSVRAFLPGKLKAKVPPMQRAGAWPKTQHAHKVLMLAGCVQPAMLPNINTATARVLDACGFVGVLRVVLQHMTIVFDHHATARGVHHDGLHLTALDIRPPRVDVGAHVCLAAIMVIEVKLHRTTTTRL